jgi:hypothetical protein
MRFKEFLLNEGKVYLGSKIGEILSAVQSLEEDEAGMGAREYVRFCEKVVVAIRRILHSDWTQKEYKYLKSLQKVGVAIMRAIEKKDDLKEVMKTSRQELEKISAELGLPVNQIGGQEAELPEDAPTNAPPSPQSSPEQSMQQQPQQQPPQPMNLNIGMPQ